MDHSIDVLEQNIVDLEPTLLAILLRDETTGQNIRWGTSDYEYLGAEFAAKAEMWPELITGEYAEVIKPRILKEKETQLGRTRGHAEVFTPSWVCNRQNNLIDESWFGRENVFNTETEDGWVPTKKKITFPRKKMKSWRAYVTANRMEITCGEAPYLVSRYDTVSGEPIPLRSRVGLLDRKLRVIGERVKTAEEWFSWALEALKSCYAYDYQGDNVLLARENVLASVSDYYCAKFNLKLSVEQLRQAAIIIAWNIWQMNGLTYTAPYSEERLISDQMTMFDPTDQVEIKVESKCRIMDWQAGETVLFETLVKGR